ncbi:pentapeptide repeat protein [Thalassoporum mexicanum PCC 7367]|uniref:pentapeptide repeat-containing protein n=1 Tax=Thalassoporum mexicanum TaxID=3457544 RepID=UPI00029FA923|nr:pentapeptide repeat-containing protein [Pseudanabaena sp. PCC 7367]AFY70997.1 pentapeptide repeat protein [Pseudanabaena sp. PCC 7367]
MWKQLNQQFNDRFGGLILQLRAFGQVFIKWGAVFLVLMGIIAAIDSIEGTGVEQFLLKRLDSRLFDQIEAISILAGLIVFAVGIPAQKKRSHYEAWQVINSAQGQGGSGGRIMALQDLNGDKVSLAGLTADQADLREIQLDKADLRRANLSGTNLSGASLRGANLFGANLSSADLSNADLSNADLSEANLDGANLRRVNLTKANLFVASIKQAKLSGAAIVEAELSGANLGGASFSSASLKGSFLSLTNFTKAKGLKPEQLFEAQEYEKAIYDNEFLAKLNQHQSQTESPPAKTQEKPGDT